MPGLKRRQRFRARRRLELRQDRFQRVKAWRQREAGVIQGVLQQHDQRPFLLIGEGRARSPAATRGDFGGILGVGEVVRRPFGDIDAITLDEPVPAVADAHDAEIIVADRRQPDREAAIVPA